MGIKRLTTILKINSDGIKFVIPLSAESVFERDERTIEIHRIAVDASAVFLFLAQEENPDLISSLIKQLPPNRTLDFLLLPDYARFEAILEAFIAMGQSAGFEFVWYFDGSVSIGDFKASEHLSRTRANLNQSLTLMAAIENKLSPDLMGFRKQMPLAILCGLALLQRLNQQIVQCVGEADVQLDCDSRNDAFQFDAVLSNDSDFFFAPHGLYYFIPLWSMILKDDLLSFQLWDSQTTSRSLERSYDLAPNSINPVQGPWLISALLGNDYTTHLLPHFGHLAPTVPIILRFATRPDIPPPIQNLLDEFPEFRYTRTLYQHPESIAKELQAKLQSQPNDQAIFERVSSFRWPRSMLSSCLSTSYVMNHAVLMESQTLPTTATITLVLRLITMQLAGVAPDAICTMNAPLGDGKIVTVPLSVSSLPPCILKHPFLPCNSLSDLMSSCCALILAFHPPANVALIHRMLTEQMASLMIHLREAYPLLSEHQLVFILAVLIYLTQSSAFYDDQLSGLEISAFIHMILACFSSVHTSSSSPGDIGFIPTSVTVRSISLSSRYQGILQLVYGIFHILLGPDFATTSPRRFFDAIILNDHLTAPQSNSPSPVFSMISTFCTSHLPEPTPASSIGQTELEINQHQLEEDDSESPSNPFPTTKPVLETLPIDSHRDLITSEIRNNCMVILHAETGSGKSTRVARMILDDESSSSSLIVIIQPRRMAAISLATRVAHELGENLGSTVGYAIGQDSVRSHSCRILYVTVGWMLHKILGNKSFFFKCSHIIIDEVHERSLDGDLLLLLSREYLLSRGGPFKPKLIAMSATIEADILKNYFACIQDAPIPSLFVGANRYATRRIFLEELTSSPLFADDALLRSSIQRLIMNFPSASQKILPPPYTDTCSAFGGIQSVILQIILRINNSSSEPCCILVFLPGMLWIESLYDMLMSTAEFQYRSDSFEVIVLHGQVENSDQQRALSPIPSGKLRILLATNIAESSLTFPYVRYVIDLGLHRHVEYSPTAHRTLLSTNWISKSSVTQRGGRTGRMCKGFHFCMFTRTLFKLLPEFTVPEMLRISLASAVLNLKNLSEEVYEETPLSNPRTALELAIQPPDSANITSAIEELFDLELLIDELETSDDLDEKLARARISLFGQLCLKLPFDFSQSRLVFTGARAGRFIAHMTILAVGNSLPDLFVKPYPFTEDLTGYLSCFQTTQLGRQQVSRGDLSDCLLSLRIYLMYRLSPSHQTFTPYGIHLPRLRTFVRTVEEIAPILESLFPAHRDWLEVLRSTPMDRSPQLTDVVTVDPTDIDFCRFLLAHTFAPLNGLMKGGSSKHLPEDAKESIFSMPLWIPDTLFPSFKNQIKTLFPSSPPFLVQLLQTSPSSQLPQTLRKDTFQRFTQMKNDESLRKEDFTSTNLSFLDQHYSHVSLQFASLDPPDDPLVCIRLLPLPIRVLDSAFSSRPYFKFPSLPGTLTEQQILTKLFAFSSTRSSSSSSFSDSASEKPFPHFVFRSRGSYQTKWTLRDAYGSMRCSVDSFNLLCYLTAAQQHSMYAVPADIDFSGKKNQPTAITKQVTLISGDPYLFALIMLTLTAPDSPPQSEALTSVEFQGKEISLNLSILPSFFRLTCWQSFRSLFDDENTDSIFNVDSVDLLPGLSPDSISYLVSMLHLHSTHLSPPNFKLPKIDPSIVGLCVASICASSPTSTLSLTEMKSLMYSTFPISHPDTLVNFLFSARHPLENALTFDTRTRMITFLKEKLPKQFCERISICSSDMKGALLAPPPPPCFKVYLKNIRLDMKANEIGEFLEAKLDQDAEHILAVERMKVDGIAVEVAVVELKDYATAVRILDCHGQELRGKALEINMIFRHAQESPRVISKSESQAQSREEFWKFAEACLRKERNETRFQCPRVVGIQNGWLERRTSTSFGFSNLQDLLKASPRLEIQSNGYSFRVRIRPFLVESTWSSERARRRSDVVSTSSPRSSNSVSQSPVASRAERKNLVQSVVTERKKPVASTSSPRSSNSVSQAPVTSRAERKNLVQSVVTERKKPVASTSGQQNFSNAREFFDCIATRLERKGPIGSFYAAKEIGLFGLFGALRKGGDLFGFRRLEDLLASAPNLRIINTSGGLLIAIKVEEKPPPQPPRSSSQTSTATTEKPMVNCPASSFNLNRDRKKTSAKKNNMRVADYLDY